MEKNVYLYILVMALVTYLIRALPLTLIKTPIENRFFRSFLYYVPYVTLAVMTFPSILTATRNPIAGGAALILGIFLAWKGKSLFTVALFSCIGVFLLEWILI